MERGEKTMRQQGQRAAKTIETENTLLLILSEGRSLSIQFQEGWEEASRLPRFTLSSEEEAAPEHAHTHTQDQNKSQYTYLAGSYTHTRRVTSPGCRAI